MARFKTALSLTCMTAALGIGVSTLAGPTAAAPPPTPTPTPTVVPANPMPQSLADLEAARAEKDRAAAVSPTGPQSELEKASARVSAYSDANGGLGIYYAKEAGRFAVRVPRSGIGSKILVGPLSLADVPSVSAEASRFTKDELDAAITQLRLRAWHPSAVQYTYAFTYDAEDDNFSVSTNAPSDVVEPLIQRFPDLISYRYSAKISRTSRLNDPPPHRGGADIHNAADTKGCTSGFTFTSSTGRYMSTTGHCFPPLTKIYSHGVPGAPWWYWGWVASRPNFPAYDLEAIGKDSQGLGGSYGSVIYVGDWTGTTILVGGSGTVAVGSAFCRSGVLSAEICGLVVRNLSVELCDYWGCTPGLMRLEGHEGVFDGDSGSPIYNYGGSPAKVYARGLVVGDEDVYVYVYAEKITGLIYLFSATIATS